MNEQKKQMTLSMAIAAADNLLRATVEAAKDNNPPRLFHTLDLVPSKEQYAHDIVACAKLFEAYLNGPVETYDAVVKTLAFAPPKVEVLMSNPKSGPRSVPKRPTKKAARR